MCWHRHKWSPWSEVKEREHDIIEQWADDLPAVERYQTKECLTCGKVKERTLGHFWERA